MSTFVTPKTFAELALYWLITYARERKAASSIKRDHGILKNYLLPKFGGLEVGEFTIRDVEFWISHLVATKTMSKKSANDVLVVLSKILNDAVRWNFLESNPLSRVAKFSVGQK